MYWWTFLRELFYCYSQEIISAVANMSLIPYKLIKKAPETQNLLYCNTECQPRLNKKCKNTAQFSEQEILFHTNINNKSTCKIVCKMEYLKNGL